MASGKRWAKALTSAALLTLSAGLAGCGAAQGTDPAAAGPESGSGSACRQLDASLVWPDGSREELQKAIDAHSVCVGTAPGTHQPVAIFDWDNTVIKNDIGYGTNLWMLRQDKVLQPEDQDWKTTGRYLTDVAAAALSSACGTGIPAGQPLPTSTDSDCADEIVAILDGDTRAGEPAFAGFDARRLNAAYSWAAALSTGYTAEELTGFAAAMKKEAMAAPVGATQTVGTQELDGYIHVYPQIKDLVATLQDHGVATWVVSASAEPIVKAWAGEAGFREDHVVGIRNVYKDGIQTPHIQGCGGVPDGDDSMITYVDGKRCWANQVIFGVQGPAAFEQLPEDRRQFLAAGDSTTDVTFVADATAARLVINRNKAELMCHAVDDADGGWLVVPMFIEPKKAKSEPYPCSTAAYENSDGSLGPVTRPDGSVIEDQADPRS